MRPGYAVYQCMRGRIVRLYRLVGQGARDWCGGRRRNGRAARTRRDVEDVQALVVLVEGWLLRMGLRLILSLGMFGLERGDDGPRRGEAAGRHGLGGK